MKLGLITDSHLCPPGTPPARWHNPYDFPHATEHLVRAIAHHLVAAVDAIVVLGDLTNNGDRGSIDDGLHLLAGAERPVWLLAGNHDCDAAVDALPNRIASASHPALQMLTARGALIGGMPIAGLPIAEVTASEWRVTPPEIDTWGAAPVLLLSHFPVISNERAIRAAGLRYAGSFAGDDAVSEALQARQMPTIVVHGHLHVRDAVVAGPVLQIGCAALIEPPHECATLTVTDEAGELTVQVSHHAVAPSPPVRLPVLAPDNARWIFGNGKWESSTDTTAP
ncbi:MAG: metallophosphoesterase [Chloroflexia bacterium]|nr:metallophosphoesterase [Chloroflexia bacterium]